MSDKTPRPLLGRLAVHLDMLSNEQVAECTREQARDANPRPVGEYFVEKGYMTREQLNKLLRAQKRVVEQHKAAKAIHAAGTSQSAEEPAEVVQPAEAAQPVETVQPAATAPERTAPLAPAPALRAASALTHVPHDPSVLDSLLRQGIERRASDIHVHAGASFKLRIQGRLTDADTQVLEAARTEQILIGALGDADRAILDEQGQIDLCYTVPGLARFRANIYRQQSGFDGVFRAIPPQPPTLEELGLPPDLARFTNYHQGMVLITGPTGCGKSSTLAALVDLVNEERKEHLLTIEDPVEYQYTPKNCLVNQRSVHRHTKSFARALRAALREDPDVIVIGELRDLETISLALSAAETGHFVLATLHTGSSIRTLNRLIGAFPSKQQDQVRTMLSESLRAVISQRLIPSADGSGRVPVLETLVVTKAVGNLIRENKTFQIHSILQTGAGQGMCLLDQSIKQAVAAGEISREEALRHVEDPKILGGG